MTSIAVFGLLFLWTDLFLKWLQYQLQVNLFSFQYFCIIFADFCRIALDFFSNYALLLFTVFRCICVIKPHQAKSLCSKKRANYALVAGAIVSLVLTIPSLALIQIRPNVHVPGTHTCYLPPPLMSYQEVLDIFNIFVMFGLVVCGNIAIIIGLYCRRSDTPDLGAAQQAQSDARNKQVTVIALGISSMYIVIIINRIVIHLYNLANPDLEVTSPVTVMTLVIASRLSYFFQAGVISFGHFLCYSIAGSKFREELKRKLACLSCSNTRN